MVFVISDVPGIPNLHGLKLPVSFPWTIRYCCMAVGFSLFLFPFFSENIPPSFLLLFSSSHRSAPAAFPFFWSSCYFAPDLDAGRRCTEQAGRSEMLLWHHAPEHPPERWRGGPGIVLCSYFFFLLKVCLFEFWLLSYTSHSLSHVAKD